MIALHRFLRKNHPAIDVLAIPVVFFHCRIAAHITGEESMLGAVLLILTILLALSYYLRKSLGRYWIRVRRVLSAAFALLVACHRIIEIVA